MTTSGVQELIDTLKNQGVDEGKIQAEQIIKAAQKEASQILAAAQTDADKLYTEAKTKIEAEKAAGHEAIKLAFRDTELALRSRFQEAFSNYLRRLVSYELQDKELIKQLVLNLAASKKEMVKEAPQIEIQIPQAKHLLLGITTEMLREGVELVSSKELQGGIRVQLVGEDMQIDLSDEALSSLLLHYLLPRYRAIVSGQE